MFYQAVECAAYEALGTFGYPRLLKTVSDGGIECQKVARV